jgi:hypothetical protein
MKKIVEKRREEKKEKKEEKGVEAHHSLSFIFSLISLLSFRFRGSAMIDLEPSAL